jgi:6-pyruvoyltetrahydropterin/6-carboxytetrahydropterin synthase
MFEVEVTATLKFSHRLEGFGEAFEAEHEHTWRIFVTLSTKSLDNLGVAVDFVRLKKELIELLEPYQGSLLNKEEAFKNIPPTAENIALLIADRFLQRYPALLKSVAVGSEEELARYIVET